MSMFSTASAKAVLGADGAGEGVEVDDYQVDGSDLLGGELGEFGGAREDAAVDVRVQGFDATAE